MSIELPPESAGMVKQLISAGHYGNESEVISEGIRLVCVKERLREEVAQGLTELDEGKRAIAPDVYQQARQRVRTIAIETSK